MATQAQEAKSGSSMVIASQIDYEQKAFSHGELVYTPQYPNNYGVPTLIGNGSATNVTIILPPEVYNLSQSYLNGVLTIPSPTTGQYVWTYGGVGFGLIQSIQFYGSSNQLLVDIDNVQNYLNIVGKKEMSQKDFLSSDYRNGMSQSNSLVGAVPAQRFGNSTLPVSPLNPASVNYLEPNYFNCGAIGAASAGGSTPGQVVINFSIPLNLIKNTLFAVDKNLFFGNIMYMKITFGSASKICYMSSSNANPSSGTPAPWVHNAAPLATEPTSIQVTNLQLMLAMENKEEIKETLKRKVATTGLELFIPWTRSYKATNSSSSQSIPHQFTPGEGVTLQKIIHAIYNVQESLDTAYDCSNVANAPAGTTVQKISSFYTMLNGRRLGDLAIDCTTLQTDYMCMKKLIKGSVMQNASIYQHNWFWEDDFTGYGAVGDQEGRPNLVSGIPLTSQGPLIYTFVGTNMVSQAGASPLNNNYSFFHYDYVTFTRKLSITPGMASIN